MRSVLEGDAGTPGWLAGLGLPGMVDLHVHFMPEVPMALHAGAGNGARLLGIAGPDW
jgi:cytosine/adenosine deaminase-related metal-dependent hydrolase